MSFESLYFGAPGQESFGCLHPANRPGSTGLVVCSAFGREELCVHRTLRHIAEGAAARGMPALRFDYPCTGDSAGDELASGQVARWIGAIGEAIDLLRARTGVQRVVVLGFRIGALLACEAVRGRSDVAGVVAFAPPSSGRLYVRELRMAALKLNPGDGETQGELLETGGYAMSADSQATIAALGFDVTALPAGCPVLVIDRDDRPPVDAPWIKALRESGQLSRRMVVNGYADMMAPSFRAVVPQLALEELLGWLEGVAAQLAPGQGEHFAPRPVAITDRLVLRDDDGREVHERVVVVDTASGMQGVLTEPGGPGGPQPETPTVLLLPPGADRRVGPGRLYVTLARELARKGQRVLRLDISGVGDSPVRPGCQENAVYQPEALLDVAAATAFLRKFPNSARIRVVGHCSGAYNALRNALTDESVSGITLINPLAFFWIPGMVLEDPLGSTNLAAAAQNYRQHMFSLHHWQALLRRPRRLLHVANVLLRWPLSLAHDAWRDLMRRFDVRLADDLGRELLVLAEAGVGIHFFFSTGDPGEMLLRSQAGSVVGRLLRSGRMTLLRIPGADHDLSFRRDRLLLLRHLLDQLEAGAA